MPIVVQDGQVPTIISKPNQRYAATALSTEYRRFAVNGEILKDPASGEIFYKRKTDGKIVSFFQNKKFLHDMMLELRVLLNNNIGFTYPEESETAFFLCTNYDLVTINKEVTTNIYTDNNVLTNSTADSLYQLRFKVCNDSNGFFCRVGTRDCDKPLIEVLTNFYNRTISSYTGTNTSMVSEKKKMDTIPKWYDSNATLLYTVTVYYMGRSVSYSCTDYIRLNESCMVPLPTVTILKDFPDGIDDIVIDITGIDYDKLHFVINNQSLLGNNVADLIAKYQFQEKHLEAQAINIMHFIEDYEDYLPLGNETVLAFLDMPYVRRYLGKMTSLMTDGDFMVSIKRPLADEWFANGAWAEVIRSIDTNGNISNTGSENSGLMGELEEIFSPNRIHHGELTTDATKVNDFLLADIVYV